MEKQGISRFLPYEADYQTLSYCRNWTGKMLWLVAGLSVILPLIPYLGIPVIYNIFNCMYFILIILYYVADMYTETFLYPATARKRRKGFIDNSLGSKFLDKQVKGYYSNDSLEYGPFKMLVNCGENCFFTLNIAKKMIPSVILKNVIAGIGFLIVAYRSAAYMCRYVAKSLVANDFATECQVAVSYNFGEDRPAMIVVTADGEYSEKITKFVKSKFDFSPNSIIERLNLRFTKYYPTSKYGHFTDPKYEWEKICEL